MLALCLGTSFFFYPVFNPPIFETDENTHLHLSLTNAHITIYLHAQPNISVNRTDLQIRSDSMANAITIIANFESPQYIAIYAPPQINLAIAISKYSTVKSQLPFGYLRYYGEASANISLQSIYAGIVYAYAPLNLTLNEIGSTFYAYLPKKSQMNFPCHTHDCLIYLD